MSIESEANRLTNGFLRDIESVFGPDDERRGDLIRAVCDRLEQEAF